MWLARRGGGRPLHESARGARAPGAGPAGKGGLASGPGRGVSCSLAGRLVAVRLPRNEAGGRLVRRPGYADPVRRVAVTWH